MVAKAKSPRARVIEPVALPVHGGQAETVNAIELVRMRGGDIVTDSLIISREFGRLHKSVLRALDRLVEEGTLNGHEFVPVEYRDAKGEMRRCIELTEAGALTAMPFVGGQKSRIGHKTLVRAFLAMRERIHALQAAPAPIAPAPTTALPDGRIADLSLAVMVLGLFAGNPAFKFSDADRLSGMHKLMRKYSLPVDMLPPLEDATLTEYHSATHLLLLRGSSLSTPRFNRLLEEAGLLKRVMRPSSKEVDSKRQPVMRPSWIFTQAGLRFGWDSPVVQSGGRDHAPVFYSARFEELMRRIKPQYDRLLASGYRPRWSKSENAAHAAEYLAKRPPKSRYAAMPPDPAQAASRAQDLR